MCALLQSSLHCVLQHAGTPMTQHCASSGCLLIEEYVPVVHLLHVGSAPCIVLSHRHFYRACGCAAATLPLQLLDEGADVHTVAPKRANGGSPLAEAVAGKHEALVELLLRYGADPFTENAAGKVHARHYTSYGQGAATRH